MSTIHAPQRTSGIPDTLRLQSRDPRTSLADRIALHIGLRLLIWGTRTPRLTDDRERHARAHRAHAATATREHGYLREALLAPRP
ncbi:hypothetical protein [Microbacterium sp. CFBP9034]|uniref:hypothetical protein n=1 Tax=Microbacterium sp. CFBP9034 TaxID=3096540 RepID=UPI002A69D30C|nr:hypothetical protein [Microbacterium sp. CFBP9034]MDY0909473.1 hypothetical protein [Microbacterium sp. CFBP9034]